MSPKDKARKLVMKYNLIVLDTALGGGNERVKQCALIAVEEIEQALTDYGRGDSFQLQNMESEFRYWEQVKEEIERI